AKTKADADKRKPEPDAKAKAAEDKRKPDADAKAKAAADKRKADADAKAKAAEDKRKADTDAKAKAEAEAQAKAEREAKETAANKKAEAKKIASDAKAQFKKRIENAWNPPNSSGKTVSIRFILSDSGQVTSFRITKSSGDDAVDASIKAAVYSAAPYPMPEDKDAKLEAKEVTSNFTVK
ncbi:MAG: cell envelope integrity protein TolA, partial [Acinetobacter sp.]